MNVLTCSQSTTAGFLTDDRVHVLGRVFSKSAYAGALSRHSEAGQRPLAVHVLTNHRAHLPDTGQAAGERERDAFKLAAAAAVRGREQAEVLRRASVEFGVLQSKDVDGAFVAGGTQEGRVVAEVDAERGKTRNASMDESRSCVSHG